MTEYVSRGRWLVEEFGTPDIEHAVQRFQGVHASGWQACVYVTWARGAAEIVALELAPRGTAAPWTLEADIRMAEISGTSTVQVPRYPLGFAELPKQGGLTAVHMRHLDFGELVAHCLNVAAIFSTHPDSPNQATAPSQAKGLGRLTDHDLALYARDYVRLVEAGSRSPNSGVAALHHVSSRTAEGWIAQARRRGLLSKAEPGKTGGRLTAKALKALDEGEK